MKKLLLSFVVVAATMCSASAPERTVYVCVSKTAYAYHLNRNCSGLARCTHEIKSESESTAIADGRKLCKICGK